MPSKKKIKESVQTDENLTANPTDTGLDYDWPLWGPREVNEIVEANTKAWLNYWTGVMNSFWGTGKK